MSWHRSGEVLGNRYVVESLATGGMAEVYLCRDQETDERVAVKTVSREISQDPQAWRRFEAEAGSWLKLGGSVGDAYLLVLTGSFTFQDRKYFVMPYCPGGDLRRRIARGRLSPSKGLELAMQLLIALDVLHTNGIVHRDLKPDNILSPGEGTWLLADLGIARVGPEGRTDLDSVQVGVHGPTADGVFIGTPGYAAPEQFRSGLGEVSPRTDLWAWAVTVLEALSGQHPAGLQEGTLRRILPGSILKLIRRALQVDPSRRPESAREVAENLAGHVSFTQKALRFPWASKKVVVLNEALSMRWERKFFAAQSSVSVASVRMVGVRTLPEASQLYHFGRYRDSLQKCEEALLQEPAVLPRLLEGKLTDNWSKGPIWTDKDGSLRSVMFPPRDVAEMLLQQLFSAYLGIATDHQESGRSKKNAISECLPIAERSLQSENVRLKETRIRATKMLLLADKIKECLSAIDRFLADDEDPRVLMMRVDALQRVDPAQASVMAQKRVLQTLGSPSSDIDTLCALTMARAVGRSDIVVQLVVELAMVERPGETTLTNGIVAALETQEVGLAEQWFDELRSRFPSSPQIERLASIRK